MTDEEQQDYGEKEYLVHRLLEQVEKTSDFDLSKTKFYKLVCIADRHLKNDLDRDIEFPRYWYQYGEVPWKDGFNTEFFSIASTGNGYNKVSLVDNLPESAFNIADDVTQDIERTIQWVVRQFRDDNAEDIEEYHYERHSPTEFVRTFHRFRGELKSYDPGQATFSSFLSNGNDDQHLDQLQNRLEQLILAYPEEKYDSMYNLFLRWENTIRLLLDQGDVESAQDLSRKFWMTICRVELRLHNNQNIPGWKIENWRRLRNSEKTKFENALEEIREEALANVTQTDELEAIAEPYSETMRESF